MPKRRIKKNCKEDLDRDKPLYPHQKITITTPVPPSINHMYVNVGRGSKRLTKQAKDFIKDAQHNARKAIKEQGWKKDKDNVWYVMDLYFFFPDKRIRDSHNTLKILTDSLEGLLFLNDYFLLPRIQFVCLDRSNPRLEIVFYPLTERNTKYEKN